MANEVRSNDATWSSRDTDSIGSVLAVFYFHLTNQ
jgi:hypothetical protein